MDIDKQVTHWAGSAVEDLATAEYLLDGGKTRPALFFAHLALEKMLKAHVCRATEDLAPRIHNLRRLAGLSRTEVTREHLEILARMNEFNIEGRYPELLPAAPTVVDARRYLAEAKEVFGWLQQTL